MLKKLGVKNNEKSLNLGSQWRVPIKKSRKDDIREDLI